MDTNFFASFFVKERSTFQGTPAQNILISCLFKAKPPNHTFSNSHSVSVALGMLSEQRAEFALHTVLLSSPTTILQGYFLSLEILLPSGTTLSRKTEPDPLWNAGSPLLECWKAGISVLLWDKRKKDLRIRPLPPGKCVDLMETVYTRMDVLFQQPLVLESDPRNKCSGNSLAKAHKQGRWTAA